MMLGGYSVDVSSLDGLDGVSGIKYNFRSTAWGMTPEMVERSETLRGKDWVQVEDEKKKDTLVYLGHLKGSRCLLIYKFIGGGLARASYTCIKSTKAFSGSFDELSQKYGEPISTTKNVVTWLSKDKKTMIHFELESEGIEGTFSIVYYRHRKNIFDAYK